MADIQLSRQRHFAEGGGGKAMKDDQDSVRGTRRGTRLGGASGSYGSACGGLYRKLQPYSMMTTRTCGCARYQPSQQRQACTPSSPRRKTSRSASDLRAQIRALKSRRSTEEYQRDCVAFARDLLGLELDDWQASVLAADSKRDILNCSRQAGKSTTAAVLALHEAMFVPSSVT